MLEFHGTEKSRKLALSTSLGPGVQPNVAWLPPAPPISRFVAVNQAPLSRVFGLLGLTSLEPVSLALGLHRVGV